MTKSQKLRKLLGDPYTTGPRACMRTTHVSGPCSKCGAPMEPAHNPLHLPNLYCGVCCPACCTAPVEAPVPMGATTPVLDADAASLANPDARGGHLTRCLT
jgi:hypothetical protein